MKNRPKGFILLLLIAIVAVLVVVLGIYYKINNEKNSIVKVDPGLQVANSNVESNSINDAEVLDVETADTIKKKNFELLQSPYLITLFLCRWSYENCRRNSKRY